jgi:hypothetical protein
MAKKLEQFPDVSRPGRPDKYPWDEWLDGDPWELTSGEDFQAKLKIESFRATAKSAAKKRSGTIKTAVVNDGKSLVIQFIPIGKK